MARRPSPLKPDSRARRARRRACCTNFSRRRCGCGPTAPALECDDAVLTYAELDRHANGFAAALQSQGVGPGALVALYAEKSSRLFAAMLGVLKAGAGYVPLDPKFPLARVQGILEDANIAVAICDAELERGAAPARPPPR